MENNISSLLEDYGLNKKEIRIYILLVQKGELNAYVLAKLAGIHRSTTYAILDRLTSKGFISRTQKDNKILYSAVDINQTITRIKEKEAILLSLIPEFEKIKQEEVSNVRVLENEESQRRFNFNLFNQIERGKIKDLYILSGGPSETINLERKKKNTNSEMLLENLLRNIKKKKLYQKIKYRGIWNEKFKGSELLKFFSAFGENKFLKELPTLATMVIFGDSIAYLFTIDNKSQVIEIQNKLIAKENKAYFSYLWKQAKE